MQIVFTKSGANTAIGGFSPGDRANVSDALAKHLVEELDVAKYGEAVAPKASATKPAAKAPARKGR